ncbi:indole-3-glycerol-phosphate synthase TrpC, partial [Neisseria meningitidis]
LPAKPQEVAPKKPAVNAEHTRALAAEPAPARGFTV